MIAQVFDVFCDPSFRALSYMQLRLDAGFPCALRVSHASRFRWSVSHAPQSLYGCSTASVSGVSHASRVRWSVSHASQSTRRCVLARHLFAEFHVSFDEIHVTAVASRRVNLVYIEGFSRVSSQMECVSRVSEHVWL